MEMVFSCLAYAAYDEYVCKLYSSPSVRLILESSAKIGRKIQISYISAER